MPRVPKDAQYLNEEQVRRILERMNALGMKRVELARELGYSNGSYVTRLEKGELRIRIDQVGRWASALQCTSDYILGLDEEPYTPQYLDKKDKKIRKILVLMKNMTDKEFRLWIKIGQDIVNAKEETYAKREKE